MRRSALFAISALILVFPAQPANAGGWWTTFDVYDQPFAIGESLTVTDQSFVLFRTMEDIEQAKTTAYFAYVVTAYDEALLDRAMTRPDPKKWWEPLSPLVKVGEVSLTGWDANLARARVHLDIPDVAPGQYFLMLCDAGCETPLGNHIPVPVHITTDVMAARTARRVERMDDSMDLRFARSRNDVRKAARAAREAQQDSNEAINAIARLAARMDATPATTTSNPLPMWVAYAGWFVAGGYTAFLIRRRPLRHAATPDVIIEHIPDDARELTEDTSLTAKDHDQIS